MAPTDRTRPIVISGPSGAGKSTLIERLKAKYPDRFGFSVSHTTRQPRQKRIDKSSTETTLEEDGVDYHFVSKDAFKALVDADGFIEHAQFGSNLYGTSKNAVKDVANKGQTCLLDIEMEGVKQVKKTDLNARFLFVQPPNMQILEQRLRGRDTDKEEAIQERLRQAQKELDFAATPGVHDKIIVNDDLEKAWDQFETFCVPDRTT